MKILSLLLALGSPAMLCAQEICTNGIDDDGDGLADLYDPDCNCQSGTIPSLITNASFEGKSACPSDYSQLGLATPWIQPTKGTTDYMNKCGYVMNLVSQLGLGDFPDGNGIAAGHFMPNLKEYLGSVLAAPLVSGTSYRLRMNIAATLMDGYGNATAGQDVSVLDPVYVTLFGNAASVTGPVDTFGTPAPATGWIEIGKVLYNPVSQWQVIEIDFTAPFQVKSLMIGPPETLPASYGTYDFPYFLFDSVVLNKAAAFGVAIVQQGNLCDGDRRCRLQLSRREPGCSTNGTKTDWPSPVPHRRHWPYPSRMAHPEPIAFASPAAIPVR